MSNEILYHTAEGVAIYKGEKPPSQKELHKAPESYSPRDLNNMSPQRRRELAREFDGR